MNVVQLRQPNEEDLEPQVFFDAICPALMRLRADALKPVGGTCRFRLTGPGGGDWVLDFNRGEVLKSARTIDLDVEVTALSFQAFLNGRLDINKATKAGQFRFIGRRSVFRQVALLTKPVTH